MPNPFLALYAFSLTVPDRLKALKDEEKGASAMEYALLVGLIAVVLVAAIATFGTKLSNLFSSVDTSSTPATHT